MKKVFSLMLLLATMLTFAACSSDEPETLKVYFKESEITLQFWGKYKLEPIVESGNFDPSKAVWASSDERVAVVNNGYVDALFVFGGGEATISLSYDGIVLAMCKVIVTPIKINSIALDHNKLNLVVGESVLLRTTFTSDSDFGLGVVYNLIWESSDKNTAIVSDNGEVVAIAPGRAIITVSDTESGLSDKCEVVVASKPVIGIACSESVKTIVDESIKIKATIMPEDATNKTIIWTSLDPSVATVDNEGNVYGVALGKTVVTAKTEDGGFEAKCNVMVVELPDIVTANAIEGWTVSGANSNCHLTLMFDTNTNIPVLINSVIMTNQDGTIMNTDYPNEYYTNFQKTYITHYFNASGGISGEAINAEKAKIKGWKFYVEYTWNNNKYTIECVNQ